MRPAPEVLPAPVAAPTGPPPLPRICQACGTTAEPLERTTLRIGTVRAPDDLTVVHRCVDPVQCELRARIDGTWCTYP